MRKRVLGTIAALTVGAGAAFAQSPPPSPVGYDRGFQPAGGPTVGEIIAPPPGAFGPPGAYAPPDGPAGEPGPGYPPGLHGQQAWEGAFSQSAPAASRFYLDSQFLLWFVKAQPTNVPYVSTSAPQDIGLAGRPTTTLLHSNSDLGYNVFSGFNIVGGWFKDADRRYGVELGGMLLERKSNVFNAASDNNGIPLLARPFIEATTGAPAVLTVAQQGLASGSITVKTSNKMYGAEGSLLTNLYRSCPDDGGCRWNVNGLVGFRYWEIREDLRIDSASTILGNGGPLFNGAAIFSGAVVGVSDNFVAVNHFYGGQVGINANVSCGTWDIGLKAKVAAGVMNQVLDVDGRSNLLDTQRALFSQAVGGLFANAQNMGRYRNDEFAVIPEVGLSVGRNWSSWLTTAIGYNYMQVNRVIRPGNAVNNVVNSAIIPTSTSFGRGAVVPVPNNALTQDEYWAQGVTFHIIMRY